MTVSYGPLTRRETLAWMAAVFTPPVWPRGALGALNASQQLGGMLVGYGTDPNLQQGMIPWPLVMESLQLRQTAMLADLVLPPSDGSPAPSALGIADFVNEWISAPYPEQSQDRVKIFDGLRWVDGECTRRGYQTFLECDASIREAVLSDIAHKPPKPVFAAQSEFFRRFRFLVISAYYTTPEGFKDIGYTGNAPMESYPAVTDEERAILERALSKLGLSHR